LENFLETRPKTLFHSGLPQNPAQAEAEDSSKIKDRLEALLFAETLQGTLSPNANPGKGSVGGLHNWMPKATARIQRAAQTHSHLSSTRFVIPNGSGLRKGGIKKVTGGCATRFLLGGATGVLARPSHRVCGIIGIWLTSAPEGRIAGEKSLVMPSPVVLTLRKPGRVRQPKSWWRKSGRRTPAIVSPQDSNVAHPPGVFGVV
jgi:hypothetical protein